MLENNIPLERHDCINGRYYSNNDGNPKIYHPSVTTILKIVARGEQFNKWLGNSNSYEDAMDYANHKASIGTVTHIALEYMLQDPNSVIDLEPIIESYNEDNYHKIPKNDIKKVAKCVMGALQFFKENEVVPEALELQLWDRELPYSGTADLICKVRNQKTGKFERWLIDFKTGRENPEVELQLTFYKRLFEKIYKQKIKRIGALYVGNTWMKKPTYKLKEFKYNPKLAKNVLELYAWKYGKNGQMPKPYFSKEYPTVFSLNKIEGVYNEWSDYDQMG
tara:strand:- start:235 stop:1068 length:834 start_codon:yes stop_codon:yes gene_type:complete